MLKTIDAVSIFPEKRPGVIPSDATIPDWTCLVERTQQFDPSRYPLEPLKVILRRENERTGAGVKTLNAISSIGNDTSFVVAGQQAGLFGGPLYTLYKSLHTIRLSERLSDETGRNVLPLFWIASDDHDFAEVSGIGVRTADGRQHKVEYTPETYTEGVPVGCITLDDGVSEAIQHLAENMLAGDRSDRYLDMVRSAWKPGMSWSDAFSAQMLSMCSSFGLILIDPRWKGIKELFSQVMAAEISNPTASVSLVNKEADGFGSARERRKALRKPAGATNLFLEVEKKRCPVHFDGALYTAGNETFTESELLGMLSSSPDKFSPGAALRPVCQDALLPVVAMIGGPGERLYLRQVKPLYDLFGINGSIVWPRASFTLIDQRIMRTSHKEGIPLDKLFENPEKIRSVLAYDSFPENLKNEIDALKKSVINGFEGLGKSFSRLDPTL